jgi:hypothetical protein
MKIVRKSINEVIWRRVKVRKRMRKKKKEEILKQIAIGKYLNKLKRRKSRKITLLFFFLLNLL